MSEFLADKPREASNSGDSPSSGDLEVNVGASFVDESEPIASMDAIMCEWHALLQTMAVSETPEEPEETEEIEEPEPEPLVPIVWPIALELSCELTYWACVETAGTSSLEARFPLMRDGLFYELGVQLPGVRMRGECSHHPANLYLLKINEAIVARGQIEPKMIFVNESTTRLESLNIEGDPATNPANGMPATWVSEEHKDSIEEAGYTTWDAPGYIILHLSSVLRRFASELLGVQEVQVALDSIEPAFPALIKEVCPKLLSLSELTSILRRLVEEEISIYNLKGVLEALAEWARVEKDPALLTEYVRMSMKRYITQKYSHWEGTLVVYLLDPCIEEAIKDAIQKTDTGDYLSLEPGLAQDILDAVRSEIDDLPATAQQPVILTNVEVRRYFRQLVALEFPHLAVLSFQEVNLDMDIRPVARISVQRVDEPSGELPSVSVHEVEPSREGTLLPSPRKWLQSLLQKWRQPQRHDKVLIAGVDSVANNDIDEEIDEEIGTKEDVDSRFEKIQLGLSEDGVSSDEPGEPSDSGDSGDSGDDIALNEESEPEANHPAPNEGDIDKDADPVISEAQLGALEEDEARVEADDSLTSQGDKEGENAPPTEEISEGDALPDDASESAEKEPSDDVAIAEEVSAVSAYASQWDYLEERLVWLKMQLLYCRGQQLAGKASYLWREDELHHLLPSKRVWADRETFSSTHLNAIEKVKQRLSRRIEACLGETSRQGGELAFERLKQSFRLDHKDEQILLLLLLFTFEPGCESLHYLMPTMRTYTAPTIQLATWILSPTVDKQSSILHRFGPRAPLRKHRLIHLSDASEQGAATPFEGRRFFLDPDVLLQLTKEVSWGDDVLEDILPLPVETLQSIDLPEKVTDSLRNVLARFLAEQGPGIQGAEEEPLEQLYVFDTSDTNLPNWKEIFAGGLVLLFGIHLDEEGADDVHDRPVALPDRDVLARKMSGSIRRELLQVKLAENGHELEGDRVLQDAFREARLQRASLFIETDDIWGQRSQKAQCSVLEEELLSFPGVVFLSDWKGELPQAWQHKVVLRLEASLSGEWTLSQEMGPTALRQVQRHGLEGLEEHLALRIVGQQSALQRISHVVRTAKAQLDVKPERPDGVFLLAGPSGSGKTETAIALNDVLFGTPETFLRLDMSEYHFRESISGLIGTTAGYVGFGQGGRLTNFVQKQPESVILLDEIEKAHPLVLDIFLQVFDAGRLTNGQGNTIDLSRVTFLVTTNIGADTFATQKRVGFIKEFDREQSVEVILGQLRKRLRPEFINRFDELLVFFPLDKLQLMQICQRQLRQFQERFARRGLWLEMVPTLAKHIVEHSPTEKGARAIQRSLERLLSQPLTGLLLEHPGIQHVSVIIENGKIVIKPGKQ